MEMITLAEQIEAGDPKWSFSLIASAWEAINGDDAFGRSLDGEPFQAWWNKRTDFYRLLEAGASLDAAMTLVPEGLEWAVRWVLSLNNGGALGNVRLANGVGCNGVGDTPALALTAACLRSRAATLGDGK